MASRSFLEKESNGDGVMVVGGVFREGFITHSYRPGYGITAQRGNGRHRARLYPFPASLVLGN
jgi:hypothetical protein